MPFKSQTFTVSDLYEWFRDGELILQPKFQRRLIWSPAAKSYLIDTVFRELPIPKIYLRMDIDPTKVRAVREVVDGQQRLDALFAYIEGDFVVYSFHNEEIAGKRFKDLHSEQQ